MTGDVVIRAQRILDRAWLDQDFPLGAVELSDQLSGPTGISGIVHIDALMDIGAEPWGTWLHAEIDGFIRGSGILLPWEPNEDDTAAIDCLGFSGYAHHLNVLYAEYAKIQIDPLAVVRDIWDQIADIQDLGITVDNTTSPIKIGTPANLVDFNTAAGERVTFTAGPVMLNWWTGHNYGRKMDELARDTPFDYAERNSWNSARTDVDHHLLLGYPRLGRRRDDLVFEQGTNIVEWTSVAEDEETYASDVLVTGAGSGLRMVRGLHTNRLPGRIRRTAVVSDTSITRKEAAEARAREELAIRQAFPAVRSITVDARHVNARYGTFSVGDDIPIKVHFPQLGTKTIWHRILEIRYMTDEGRVKLSLRRSDTFIYGRVA